MLPVLSSSKSPCPYSLYQIKAWVIGGSEGFKSTWYPDGVTKDGKQKYSIGHGYNDWGMDKRRWKIGKYLKDGLTWEESLEISMGELSSYKTGHTDLYVDLAFRLHIYNVGNCKSIKGLRGCCGSSVGCGASARNVRDSHNPRRKLEYALASHDFGKVVELVDFFRQKRDEVYAEYKKTKLVKPLKPNKPNKPNENKKQVPKPDVVLRPSGADRLWGLF